ncbi:MAG: endo-1,4-beta-xylanase [Clostridia bacterium]|nr:endo-1,4-beta-xylanase [Clostridia bacterium]
MRRLITLLLVLILVFNCVPLCAESKVVYVSDFSKDEDGWYGRGSAAYASNNVLHVTGRQSDWNSPGRDFELEPGEKYTFSVEVLQKELDKANFMVSVAHTSDGIETYENLAKRSVKKGRWTKIEGSYTPGEFDRFVLYVETTGAPTLSFDMRSFTLTAPENVSEIKREGPAQIEAREYVQSLKELYRDYFDFGCAVGRQESVNTARMNKYAYYFSIFTPGNELKPDSVLNVSESRKLAKEDDTAVAVHFNSAKPLLDYCQKNDLKVHGHVLVWHSQTPEAFFHVGYDPAAAYVSREVMLARLDNYIRLIMEFMKENYPGLIVSWDVVNEAVDDSSGKLRQSNWTKVVGQDFVNRAFEIARKYAPEDTLLFYNDYSTPYEPKLTGICNLLDSLLAEGNIDGYGFQCHYQISSPSISQLKKAFEKIAAKGLRLRVSELDVTISGPTASAYEQQAKRYADLMQVYLEYSDQIIAVHTWGVTDDLSWLSSQYPLLFDRNLNPKPAFDALTALVSTEE